MRLDDDSVCIMENKFSGGVDWYVGRVLTGTIRTEARFKEFRRQIHDGERVAVEEQLQVDILLRRILLFNHSLSAVSQGYGCAMELSGVGLDRIRLPERNGREFRCDVLVVGTSHSLFMEGPSL